MSNTLKLIERVRSMTEAGTDYAVAKALGMTQSNLIEIKKGKRWPGPKSQIAMSDLLKIDLKDIVAFINEDKATSEAERSHWRSLCSPEARERLAAAIAATAASLTIVVILQLVHPAIYYAHLAVRRWSHFSRGPRLLPA